MLGYEPVNVFTGAVHSPARPFLTCLKVLIKMLANDLVSHSTARAVAFTFRLHMFGNDLAPYPT